MQPHHGLHTVKHLGIFMSLHLPSAQRFAHSTTPTHKEAFIGPPFPPGPDECFSSIPYPHPVFNDLLRDQDFPKAEKIEK